MNKKFLFSVVAVVIVAAVVGAVLTMGGGPKRDTASTTEPTNTHTNSPTPESTPAEKAQATNSVTIQDMAFSPANITVKAGTTVTWTNSDSDAHTVTESDSKTGPNSGTLENGKSYTFTYDTPGTYQYHCTIHPSMMGTVTVTE